MEPPEMFRFNLLAGAAAAAFIPQAACADPPAPAPEASGAPSGDAGAAATIAQPAEPATAPPSPSDAGGGPEIVITGQRINHVDVLSGTSAVTGQELVREERPTIGDTLARLPGVSATSFG